ncbi:MAG: histidinol-phosphate transaminase [Balneolaceae bacterium]
MNFDLLIPENIKKLRPYISGKTIAEVKEEYKPEQISKLASNENRLGCSSAVKPAVINSLKSIQDYPDPLSRDLRLAIARENKIKESEIILAAGSESVISVLFRTFFNHQENAVTADATFVGFFVQAEIRGITLKKIPVTDDYKYDTQGILDAIDENTKMVYVANPNNPTGTYLHQTEYSRFIDQIPDHVLLITDEAYFEFARHVDDYPSAMKFRKKNHIILRTFSKAYGLAGFRIGYAIADERLIMEMMKTKLTFEPAAPAQAAALAAFYDEEFLERSVNLVNKNKKRLYDFFDSQNVNYVPSISNSVMIIFDTIAGAESFTRKMLENGVIIRRVHAFGLPNCIRITVGTEREMEHFEKSFMKIKQS